MNRRALRRYLRESRQLSTAVLVCVPLFALYEIGLLLCTKGEFRNAADVVLKQTLGLVGRRGALIVNCVVLMTFVVVALRSRKERRSPGTIPGVLIESSLYALLLGPLTLGIRTMLKSGSRSEVALEELVLGLGAGLYEELLFRLLALAGGALLLRRMFHVDPIWTKVTALLASSLLFSAFHHWGSDGEPWDASVFVFRFLAGLILGGLFLLRGFGVTCWTHALYDVLVSLRA